MKMLWRNSWVEVPRPHPVAGSSLIEVEASAALAPLGAAHGRRIEKPLRKVASFAITDGPAATLRKARSKRAEPAYTGDYHLVAVLGRLAPGEGLGAEGGRVVALVPRAPRCTNWILAAEPLSRFVDGDFGAAAFRAFASGVAARVDALMPFARQSYLYSGMQPPPALVGALEGALEDSVGARHLPGRVPEVLRPPAGPSGGEVLGLHPSARCPARPPLAILGAGDYVRIEVAPALAAADLDRAVICDREPQIAMLAGRELGFAEASTDAEGAIDSLERRGLVVIATAHDSHARLAARALRAGHRVFLEKPAVVEARDLDDLAAAAAGAPGELEVGFNRRHNPLVERARRRIAREHGPATIVATIREVDITPDHWYLWPNQGTRVAGNLCHWIDLAMHLLGPGPEAVSVSVSPRVSDEPTGIDAERTFSIAFDDGSTASLVPTGRGDSVRGVQEQIEVRRGPLTIRLDDLWRLRGLRSGRPIASRTLWRDKGHASMYEQALGRFERGDPAAYPERDLVRVSEVQIAATELLRADLHGGRVRDLVERARRRESKA